MKKLILLPLLVALCMPVVAQNWVTIPDENFATKLNELFPECVDGNQLNTTCTAIINTTNLDLEGSEFFPGSLIADLSGIAYFVNLEELNCKYNNLSELPELPSSLLHLNISQNDFTELPELPGSLTYLDCSLMNLSALSTLPSSLTELNCRFNDLTELPALPNTLTYLDCNNNEISTLPELPGSLTYLNCGLNDLTELPELPASLLEIYCHSMDIVQLPELPNSLTILKCENNNITVLPELPSALNILLCSGNEIIELPELPIGLGTLSCPGNNLSELPELPETLISLGCDGNELTSLPELPSTLSILACSDNLLNNLPELHNTLISLHCQNNNLTEIPELPNSLEQIRCFSNNLISLPDLPPTLTRLLCHNNQLTCLPTLPMSLTGNNMNLFFNISNNPFTCLPNYVPAMNGDNAVWLTYPLCELSDLENNPYGCSSLEGIAGAVFSDDDENCEFGEMESGLVNAPIKLLGEGDELLTTTYTFNNAFFNLMADTGAYTVQLVTENMPFQFSCDDPGDSQDVLLSEAEPSALDVDFGVECLTGHDIGTQSVTTTGWVFPGQEHALNISAGGLSAWYGLQCAEGVNGSVTINITGPVEYVGPADAALIPVATGDIQLTYDINDFTEVDFQGSFGVILETNTTAQEGDLICVEVLVEPIDNDPNPENNVYTHCYEVFNSYDPNIKQVWPQNVEPGYDGYFNYTIYFQNTGTAPAFNIRVADTLDTNLDLNTFEVTAYSHPCLTYVSGDVATFRFNNIMLPDSTSDFDGSIGYVQYRIKPVSDLPVGTVIENTAHIFFDFNDAIVTNTTENLFEITTSVAEQTKQSVQVFPNPGTGLYNVSLKNAAAGISTMEVFTLSGVLVLQQPLNSRQTVLDLTQQPPGMYLLRVQNELGNEVMKIVKH